MTTGIIQPVELEELVFGEKISPDKPVAKLIHIFGEAGSGKTTLALQLTCGIGLLGKKVIFIDTEGKVTGTKIKAIAKEKTFPKINQMLKLYVPTNFQEQHSLISNLEYYLLNQDIGLIIIDTITNLYRQEENFGKNKKNIYEKLAFQVALLRKLSQDQQIPIIIINQATMTKVEDSEGLKSLKRERVSPVAKAIMEYWVDREIILISHGWGNFEGRIPNEFKGRVKFGIDTKGIIPLD
ncbi:MAG: AAA family ATPase [Candidatus Heimdallarchaeota archaeon]|nr:AAA family ATPase [Candidatus Heimdallarchaeota archaeon]MBY8993400.1 AAA family ATPase [Candidatus Heimdallarchaeota archaeon]